MKILITGASGTAGSEVLRQALLNNRISEVTILTRRPLPLHVVSQHPKLRVVLHDDFARYDSPLVDSLEGYAGVVWALGKSANGMGEKEYEVLTKDYALAAAKALAPIGTADKKFVFAFLSGQGADQQEKSRMMFGRIKGRTEAALASLAVATPSLAVYSFRPALIYPSAPVPEATLLVKLGNFLVPALRPLMGSYVIDTKVLADGMLQSIIAGKSGTIPGWPGKGLDGTGDSATFENEEIKKLAEAM